MERLIEELVKEIKENPEGIRVNRILENISSEILDIGVEDVYEVGGQLDDIAQQIFADYCKCKDPLDCKRIWYAGQIKALSTVASVMLKHIDPANWD